MSHMEPREGCDTNLLKDRLGDANGAWHAPATQRYG